MEQHKIKRGGIYSDTKGALIVVTEIFNATFFLDDDDDQHYIEIVAWQGYNSFEGGADEFSTLDDFARRMVEKIK